MSKYLIGIIIILLGMIAVGWNKLDHVTDRWKVAEANVKSYAMNNNGLNKRNIALQLTVDQLEYFNDSILKDLDNTRKELKIKDKNLKALQHVASSFSKKDTIYIPGDTIFKESSFALDTIIGDKWYSVRLGLKYPSMIAVKPYFKSEKHIIVSSKKETVNPPKKFFLLRWFQRRHYVVHIDVVEKNPYVDNESSRYVEILR